MTIYEVLDLFRSTAYTQKLKGEKFEKLMQRWLLADPTYKNIFTKVWMWADSPCTATLGKQDLGIDLVALDDNGGYWAIQCKCYDDQTVIQKSAVDSFLANSSRKFKDKAGNDVSFSGRMWISTTNKYGKNAEQTFENQNPVVNRISLQTLDNSQVDWDALVNGKNGDAALRAKASPYEYQKPIIKDALDHFKDNERGTLIMACGTGKTLTSLFITQQMLNNKGLVLFLAPSIALVGQSLNSWFANSEKPIKAVCICSDNTAGNILFGDNEEDYMMESLTDLPIRSCTNTNSVVQEIKRYKDHDGLLVCFSTYQSIEVVSKAQEQLLKEYNGEFGKFDLVICDEAHRTAAVTISGKDDSYFTKIHDANFIQATHRLYMTATPKIYNDASKNLATIKDDLLYSMDNEEIFGKQFHTLGFGSAVQKGLLTDYKVIVLTIDEAHASTELLNAYKAYVDKQNQDRSDDEKIHHMTPEQQAMILGSVSAMSKQLLFANQNDFAEDEDMLKPMHTAIAFCDNVRRYAKTKEGTYCATEVYSAFEDVPYIYKLALEDDVDSQDFIDALVDVKSTYVSGDMPSSERNKNLEILREKFEPEERRSNIVCNVNCLSEGVDVPALDAAIFLAAKDSMITIVQSVGRVMRKFAGKKYGYIIVPVVIPIGVDANKELDNNKRYQKVWTILNAMRSHDERLAAELSSHNYRHVVVSTPRPPKPGTGSTSGSGKGAGKGTTVAHPVLEFSMDFVEKLYARMVDKVGDRFYWEKWSAKVGDVARNFIARLNELVANGKYSAEIDAFVKSLQKNINPSIDREQAITFLAQQLITKPVFDALFPDYHFATNNNVSKSFQTIIDTVQDEAFIKDREILNKFYDNVSQVCGSLKTAKDKQDTIKTLYEKFFKNAFPKTVEQLGIVYTPVACVDFIIKSVDDVLKKEFNLSLKDRGVNILDPFTGTGTFITQTLTYLKQHGISDEDLEYKYLNEIHCNEIVLLSYYIADVNIESVYNDIVTHKDYLPYDNICLTDTFQLTESRQGKLKIEGYFKENTEQINRQKQLPIRVIIGNPPYSVGQKSANDNAQNLKYEVLDGRIAETYAKSTDSTNKNSLYDSYIKAFRWASDRIHENNTQGGIVAFISNGSWLDGNSSEGFRKCIEKEFTDIYVFNLRGNARTSGELRRKEKDNVFGQGTRTPVTITILVSNPDKEQEKATIHYLDIGDYLTREQKLEKIQNIGSVLSKDFGETILTPSNNGDWISQRCDAFQEYIAINSETKFDETSKTFFVVNSRGFETSRDCWVYSSSEKQLNDNISLITEEYLRNLGKDKDNLNYDPTRISWSSSLIADAKNNKAPSDYTVRNSLYRPFFKQNVYFGDTFIHRTGQMKQLFPAPQYRNLVICMSSIGDNNYSVLITDSIPDLHTIATTQCFPLYWYESKEDFNRRMKKKEKHPADTQMDLFADAQYDYKKLGFDENGYLRHDGVTDYIQKEINARYGFKGKSKPVSKEDIFYYVYGILHSEEYRTTFEADLKKSLPRIPIVETAAEFKAFMDAGRKLADLHLNYENVEPCADVEIETSGIARTIDLTPSEMSMAAESYALYGKQREVFDVQKMRFPSKTDKSQIIYNEYITLKNIPAEAYQYVVNGKSAIEWIMERYQVTTDKDSHIKNDCNDWGREHDNPRYILDLLLSVINVSVQTVEIVKGLPKLKFD